MIRKLYLPDGRPAGYRIDHQPAGIAYVMTGGGKVLVSGDLHPIPRVPVVAQPLRRVWVDEFHNRRW